MGTLYIIAFAILFNSEKAFGGFCTSHRTAYAKTYKHCGTWGWGRCTTYRPYTVYYQYCCPGWHGSSCSIPICNNPCENGGKCIEPNHCLCPPSYFGQYCSTKVIALTTQSKISSTTTQTKTTQELMTSSRSPWMIRGNKTSDCVPELKDVLFLVDSSSKVRETDFMTVKSFIRQTVGTFDIGINKTRVGLILFNTNASLVFALDNFNTSQDIKDAVENISHSSANETNIADALEIARTQGFTYDRLGAPNIVFLITDGYPSNKTAALLQANLAKKDHLIQIVTIAVGQYVDFDDLVDIASENPYTNKSLFYSVDDFDDLHVMSLENVLTSVICGYEILPSIPDINNLTTEPSVLAQCYDKVKNCDEYMHDMCTSYRPWAMAHCIQYCGFCQGTTTPAKPCLDTIGNCQEYGPDICTSTSFRKWTKDHCSYSCGLCGPKTMTNETQSTDKPPTIPSRSPMSTLSGSMNSSCYDKISDCDLYSQKMCSSYQPWAMENCRMFCGFCKGTTTPMQHCFDTIGNCDEYGTDMCTSLAYLTWRKQHCPRFCGLCGESTTPNNITHLMSSIPNQSTPAAPGGG